MEAAGAHPSGSRGSPDAALNTLKTRADQASTRLAAAILAVALALCAQPRAEATDRGEAGVKELGELSLEDLSKIEVTSVARKPKRLSQSPAAVFVISREDIRRSGATSLHEVLRLAPGLQVARINESEWAIGARGFNGRWAIKLLVMIDGRSVYSSQFGGVHWDSLDLPLEDIERIEVIRGPGAVMWGANAVNGVINIVTRSALDTQGTSLSLIAGDSDHVIGSVRHGARIRDNAFLRVYSRFLDRGAYADDWITENHRSFHGGFRLDWTTSRDSLMVSGDALAASISDGYRPIATPLNPAPEPIDFSNHPASGTILGRWDRFVTFRNISYDPDRYRDMMGAGFVQDDIRLWRDALHLIGGVKLERSSYTRSVETQPGVQLLWMPTGALAFWGSLARAVRTPSRSETSIRATGDGQPGPGGAWIFPTLLGNPDARSERVTAYEAGGRLQRAHFSLDLAGIYNRYDHLLTVEPGIPFPIAPGELALPLWMENRAYGDSYGLEMVATWDAAHSLRFQSTYSWLRLQLRQRPESDSPYVHVAEGEAPRHQGRLTCYWNMTRRLTGDSSLYLVDRLPSLGVPGYASIVSRLGWRFQRDLEASLTVENLLDRKHLEFAPLLDRSGREPELFGRSVRANLTWRF